MAWPLFLIAVAYDGGQTLREAALLNLAIERGNAGKIAEADRLLLEATRLHFSGLGDPELCDRFAKQIRRPRYEHRRETVVGLSSVESYLREMQRRGGPAIEKALQSHIDRQVKIMRSQEPERGEQPYNLEMLTTLRRIQKRPDPIRVEIKGEYELESIFPNVPSFSVALVNRDAGRLLVAYMEGGDYRTGRLERWRFAVEASKGEASLVEFGELIQMGGGLLNYSILKPEQKWNANLTARDYVDLTPGDYTIRIQYHDSDTIADNLWLGGRIVCESAPIRLHVQPRVVDVGRKDRQTVAGLIDKLESKGKVKVLAGAYGKGSHDFIPPETPAGQLLAMGWKAVPQLIDAASNKATPPVRRAWMLGILYSITSRNSPSWRTGVLPDHLVRNSGWAIWYGTGDELSSGGIGFASTTSVSNSKLVPETQLEFARCWESFRKHIVVRDVE
ncbi:MAG: hypothetical protein KF873_03855 [Gemmataceae bacterium]|nr:hypothetical protein [Gemmataceae bacterium]